ncbi:acyltransferase family protein [Faecalitalea cylindroides]|uniref:acyltransferase family protein n=1 Tax=Faecalitalea cylindroides TaxID=39483 RepID=UPI0022E1A8F4|nr:acyltransferase [Faecalitalea cylindroides]
MGKINQREIWVDNVKVIACILVALGHFFMSMEASNILPDSDLYQWFIQTIYYFHVPLFFICSGYLYQRYSKVMNLQSWSKNVLKKLLVLGVPYFTFSFATWILKTLFSSSVNNEIGGIVDVLFIHPTSPYWYLYALFFLFLITPTFKSKKMALSGLVIALILKVCGIFIGSFGIQFLSYILSNEIWFVLGMCLSSFGFSNYINSKKVLTPIYGLGIFLILSVLVYIFGLSHGLVGFLLGLLACASIVLLVGILYKKRKQTPVFGYLAKYTMPIFLMHTLFAAPLRTVLFKLGIQTASIHVVLGLIISFVGPIIAAMIMKKSKWLEFFLYPNKFIKVK